MPPLRLFLVVILLFFLAGNLRDVAHPVHTVWAKVDNPAKLRPHLEFQGNSTLTRFGAWLNPRIVYASTHSREITNSMEGWMHRIAILLLPVSTLLLGLLFVFQRRFFLFDHAIFTMHSLSFMGLLFTATTLISMAPFLRGLPGLLGLAAPVHLFVHMRGAYGTSVPGTLLRMMLLFLFSIIAVALLFFGVAVLELMALEPN